MADNDDDIIADGPSNPLSGRLVGLCVVLGFVCLVFPFAAKWMEPNLFPIEIYLLSLSMAFGMFLAAVGGWASGKWGGWTFGGAAGTVVALYLLILYAGDPSGTPAEKSLVVRVASQELYTKIAAVEVMQENGTRLYVAPNRDLKHADVLVESENLKTGDCIAFIFAPDPSLGDTEGAGETIDIKVPAGLFREALEESAAVETSRNRMRLHYDNSKRLLLRAAAEEGALPQPVTAPGICSTLAANTGAEPSAQAWLSRWISQAFAADLSDRDLIQQLVSQDPLIRRNARDQIAARGPRILPDLLASIPEPSVSDHYRYALGALVAISKMAADEGNRAAVRDALAPDDIGKIVDLLGHRDSTMRRWAQSALTELRDPRAVAPLVTQLKKTDSDAANRAQYYSATALRDMAPHFPVPLQQEIVKETAQIQSSLDQDTAALLAQLPQQKKAPAAKTGWVYIGINFGKEWNEKHFDWTSGSGKTPDVGAEITATGNVNLRADHIQFTLKEGWQNSAIKGLVTQGQQVKVIEMKQVVPGFYWAKVELDP